MSQIRKIRYRLFAWRWFPELKPAQEPIDVVIPLVAKDLRIFPLCLEGIRNCVPHPIKDIYIVAPPQDEVIQFYYLCVDADHVLIRPHVFLTEDYKTVFYMTYEYHQPIIDHLHRFLPNLTLDNLSYVDHKMLFDKEQLKKLQETITQQTGKPWLEAAIESYDRSLSTPSAFSEFEMYGNFVQDKIRRPWLQKALRYSKLADYETLRKKWSGSRWSPTSMRRRRWSYIKRLVIRL